MALTRAPGDGPAHVIVQLASPPVALARRQGGDVGAPAREQQRLLAELARLAAPGADPRAAAAAPRVRRRFTFAFNGVALRAPRDVVERIRRLPGVLRVYRDDSVHVSLSQSVPLIRADEVWAMGQTGTGVVVGIIDTGVDYSHSALGGGFGPAYRVVAGYDYVNDDSDPMDDHGHGTHVAGIVGANGGGLMGVAPDVKLHAYKVLDAAGNGLFSDVIAAIDRAVDPDGNPFTQDGVDVINLSLSGPGDADDPAAQAVDNAVEAGVVCAVAAGNAGFYLGIGSPGTARRAITVGASDKADAMAPFSSRGPNYPDYDIKPDVTAPGVGIVSTWPGGPTLALDGTSMATPHVAGAAALLIQRFPSWDPDRIKAALMNSAVDLGEGPFVQGAGRIDVAAAATPQFVIGPSSVSFGLAVVAQPIWTTQKLVTVTNVSASFQTISLSIASAMPAGASLALSTGSVSLNPGQSFPVVITLTVDRGAVPDILTLPHAYSAALVATWGATTHRVPIAFLKAPQLVMDLDETNVIITVHDRAAYALNGYNVSPRVRLLVPPATYDVIAEYVLAPPYDTRVFEEGIVVTDSGGVDISRSEAVHTISLQTKDEQGAPVECTSGTDVFVYRPSGLRLIQVFARPTEMRISPVSESYLWGWTGATHTSRPKFYAFTGSQRGVAGSSTIVTNPATFHHETYQYRMESVVDSVRLAHFVSDGPSGHVDPWGRSVFWAGVGDLSEPLEPPYIQETFQLEHVGTAEAGELFSTYKMVFPAEETFDWDAVAIHSPYAVRAPSGALDGFLEGAGLRVFTVANGAMRIGYGPPHWSGRMSNTPGQMVLAPVTGPRLWLFLSQQGDWRPHEGLPYTLRHGTTVVESGFLTEAGGSTSSGLAVRSIAPGAYTLEIPYDGHELAGEPVHAVATLAFDTQRTDRNPPQILTLTALAGGIVNDVMQAGPAQPKSVRMRMRDDRKLRTVALDYRLDPQAAWTPLTVAQSADTFYASIPNDIAGMVSLRLFADDTTGNSLTYTVEPAFLVSDVAGTPPGTGVPAPLRLALHGSVPNPASGGLALAFTLPGRGPATLEVVDVAGRRVASREVGGLGPGRHVVDLSRQRAWAPGIYLVRLSQGGESRTAKACVLR